MKAEILNNSIHRPNKLRLAMAICMSGAMVVSLSACNEEAASELADALTENAEALSITSPADLAQKQTPEKNHGPFGFRQPGYVNQDAYISDNIFGVENLAYYGDWDSNRIYIIDVDNMTLLTSVEGTGDGPYGIDQQGPNKAYALTRRTESLTVVDNYTLENKGLIELQHKPRSTNFNANTLLSLVSGGDKAMTSIIRIDMDKVTKVVGENVLTTPHDYGGSLSTGHPLWVSDTHFFMLDRAARQIQLWNREGILLSVLDTPTSIHHIFQPPASTMAEGEQNVFYAVIEGNRDEQISPGIIRFNISHNSLEQTAQVNLHDYDPVNLDISTMGSHHADFHPDGTTIYMGSAEGHTFVIDKNTLSIVAMVDTGTGAGHTTFLPMRNQAIITNHNATYMTVIDTEDHAFVKNIEVATSASPDYKSQAHTSGVSLDMKYFYSAASHDGVFFRIDLDTWQVDKTYIGGNLLMGSYIWNGEGINM
jgi:DNA-binding beta-propeller fold protein YncE